MNVTSYIGRFAIIFIIAFITTGLVTFFYSLIVHGAGAVDWESSFRFGIILGVVLPLSYKFKMKEPQ
jgi:hypothetical protein